MTKFVVYNRTDVWKTDVNQAPASIFFTIKNCPIVRSRTLPHCINYKFMCLSAYWRCKLANERARIFAVIVKYVQVPDISMWIGMGRFVGDNTPEPVTHWWLLSKRTLFSAILIFSLNNSNLFLNCFAFFVVSSLVSPIWRKFGWFICSDFPRVKFAPLAKVILCNLIKFPTSRWPQTDLENSKT